MSKINLGLPRYLDVQDKSWTPDEFLDVQDKYWTRFKKSDFLKNSDFSGLEVFSGLDGLKILAKKRLLQTHAKKLLLLLTWALMRLLLT
jgi:hypothetical protein